METERYQKVCSYIDAHFKEMISFWKELVNMESCVREAENVNRVADFLKHAFEAEGFSCQTVDVGEGCGQSLIGILGEERGGKPIIFSGHMDTVFSKNSFGENPFHIEGNKAFGPGVLDMKGGIVIALYTCKALNEAGYKETPLKIIFSGNEENAHLNSTGDKFFFKEGAAGKFAFNMETGRIDGALCSGRKGVLHADIEVCGREAHAGNDFTSGRNAIEEMAYKIIDIQSLTNLDAGTTVNVGVINGGTVPNAVPGKCSIKIDMRFSKAAEIERLKKALAQISTSQHVSDVTSTLSFGCYMPAFETNNDVINFYEFVKETASEYGLKVPSRVYLGGGSDASIIQKAGTPVLCSFGAQGEWNHTRNEYALVDSLPYRCKLICAVVLNQKNYKN
ncbi:MAG: M20 family metallopeptidase [Clostridia bacterium]|jgi:glutamate carboxypeptidase|nr:M20 family metallopeptidase [Clostridia bacterium]MCI1999790.1 M20 family metallopeptidase [Clostridia bacterium]MCI2014294.1 M20 family metallopeptidase [Clostridia bacterium]